MISCPFPDKKGLICLTESKFTMINICNLFDLVVSDCMNRNKSVLMQVPWWAVLTYDIPLRYSANQYRKFDNSLNTNEFYSL